ncbi:MAG: 16S rRNA (cytosine(1402)-N(4))-methyltransferase RsmH [Clostridia bacterium]|jgi:16S rRNA (cytosine1402-N4)-methyltransferase|nr:16S rRNA (cytosine(1402)-N(4))-methyltransferase RsmH [Clostridia bacterium]
MDFQHRPVMLREVLSYLEPDEGKVIVDGTLGGAGHSSEILKKLGTEGLLIGIDQDQDALNFARGRLEKIGPNHRLFQANYKDFDRCLAQLGIKEIDGMLLDLGVSSFQLDREERGFSYQNDAPLDMRMNQSSGITAEELVNTWSEQELAEIIWSYGEERWAKRIAQFICEARQHTPLRTTGQLVDVIKAAIPKGARQGGPHPAKRTFQAIRIAVNDELGVLQEVLDKVVDYLKPRGRLVIISFHSLEDRIVKKSLQQQTKACICPPGLPVCQCGHVPRLKVLTKKPVLPTREEVEGNPRARSAKLRAAEKI